MEQILPDLILVWPRHLDFPLWREQLKEHRSRFNRAIIVFTNMNVGEDLRPSLIPLLAVDQVLFLENDEVEGDEDWRDVAVNKALEYSDSEWVFFTEQDFTWKPGFWRTVYREAETVDYLYVDIEGRVHPCCIIIKRTLLDETNKDFSVIRDVSDHFSRIQLQLVGKAHYVIPKIFWHHMGGLSQNLHIQQEGGTDFYNPEEFKEYDRTITKYTRT